MVSSAKVIVVIRGLSAGPLILPRRRDAVPILSP